MAYLIVKLGPPARLRQPNRGSSRRDVRWRYAIPPGQNASMARTGPLRRSVHDAGPTSHRGGSIPASTGTHRTHDHRHSDAGHRPSDHSWLKAEQGRVRSGCAGRGNAETSTSSVHQAIGEMGDPRCFHHPGALESDLSALEVVEQPSASPRRTGTTCICMSSISPSLRYCCVTFAPPPRATSLPAAASRACSEAGSDAVGDEGERGASLLGDGSRALWVTMKTGM